MLSDPLVLARELGVPDRAVEPRGAGVVKVDPTAVDTPPRGRVVLVTAMTPTPAGEGKTTTTIGLVDGLRRRGVRALGALREPSLGPLFGRKGGAVGGGKSRVEPADAINLHFTGDIHAVTSAHNLLAAVVDNHLFHELSPRIAKVTWGRVLDMNDRHLRTVEVGFSAKKSYRSRFDITAASEVMAILCLSSSIEDLRARLDRIVVGVDEQGRAITAKDVGAAGAMAAILLDATRPNLVSTLEGSPVLIHGGPFANVAQGTSTLLQTTLARRLADVVVTEAGFAFDLGGFKFLDLKCRAGGFRPAVVVLVVTVRALRFHGGNVDFTKPDAAAVTRGLENIAAHVDSMGRLGLPKPILSINRFPDDAADELAAIHDRARALDVLAVEGSYFADGASGALGLADAVSATLAGHRADSPEYRAPYELTDAIPAKIEKIATTVLGASGATLTPAAQEELRVIERMGLPPMPVCLAKTHLSISDDEKKKGRPQPYDLTVTALRVAAGAGFIVALCGPILTMPGLPKEPAAARIDIERGQDGRWRVRGLA
ncbi:MAG: formate--tetrahydrofolate ligase [Deltaproteobacteria bacterium]|nr:formate--tetrahydrofolate ligase [Deltaproteobacteria bacterium]